MILSMDSTLGVSVAPTAGMDPSVTLADVEVRFKVEIKGATTLLLLSFATSAILGVDVVVDVGVDDDGVVAASFSDGGGEVTSASLSRGIMFVQILCQTCLMNVMV